MERSASPPTDGQRSGLLSSEEMSQRPHIANQYCRLATLNVSTAKRGRLKDRTPRRGQNKHGRIALNKITAQIT